MLSEWVLLVRSWRLPWFTHLSRRHSVELVEHREEDGAGCTLLSTIYFTTLRPVPDGLLRKFGYNV